MMPPGPDLPPEQRDRPDGSANLADRERLEWIVVDRLDTLKRNPQYLTPAQMEALKASIERDGFVAPILVRPLQGGRFEVISGNHRLMAARELKREKVPCVIVRLDDQAAKRLAVNLNLIHGDPPAELLAPFLAELDDATLAQIHLDDSLRADVARFDADLAASLARLDKDLAGVSNESNSQIPECSCPTCGRLHIRSSVAQTNTPESKGS